MPRTRNSKPYLITPQDPSEPDKQPIKRGGGWQSGNFDGDTPGPSSSSLARRKSSGFQPNPVPRGLNFQRKRVEAGQFYAAPANLAQKALAGLNNDTPGGSTNGTGKGKGKTKASETRDAAANPEVVELPSDEEETIGNYSDDELTYRTAQPKPQPFDLGAGTSKAKLVDRMKPKKPMPAPTPPSKPNSKVKNRRDSDRPSPSQPSIEDSFGGGAARSGPKGKGRGTTNATIELALESVQIGPGLVVPTQSDLLTLVVFESHAVIYRGDQKACNALKIMATDVSEIHVSEEHQDARKPADLARPAVDRDRGEGHTAATPLRASRRPFFVEGR